MVHAMFGEKNGVLCKVLSAGILQPLGASVHSTKARLK